VGSGTEMVVGFGYGIFHVLVLGHGQVDFRHGPCLEVGFERGNVDFPNAWMYGVEFWPGRVIGRRRKAVVLE